MVRTPEIYNAIISLFSKDIFENYHLKYHFSINNHSDRNNQLPSNNKN